jgi:hypothetical protein
LPRAKEGPTMSMFDFLSTDEQLIDRTAGKV